MKRSVVLTTLLLVGVWVWDIRPASAVAEETAANSEAASAQEAAGEAAEPAKVENGEPAEDPRSRFELPEGGVEELVQFIEDLRSFRPQTAQEYMEYRTKGPEALQAAAEKILSLEEDKSSDAYKLATLALLEGRVKNIGNADAEEKRVIVREVAEALRSRPASELTSSDVTLAMTAARGLEYGGEPELAADAYADFAEAIRAAGDEEMQSHADRMEGAARRLRLPGNTMELTGKLLDGSEFDWDAYRGKVVLVDYWATWCGPCVAELPNVKKHFALYHDLGFDVVGISLDRSREALEGFLEKNPLPWATLFNDEAGWTHPMATYYGVSAIPTILLVDKEGKVVSLRARGDELGRLLEEQLGPVDEQKLREYEERMRRESEEKQEAEEEAPE